MKEQTKELEEILADKRNVESALQASVRAALAWHKKAGNPVAAWRDGRVVWLSPDAIPEEEPN